MDSGLKVPFKVACSSTVTNPKCMKISHLKTQEKYLSSKTLSVKSIINQCTDYCDMNMCMFWQHLYLSTGEIN